MRIENGTAFVKFTTWQCVDTFDELDLQLHLLLDKETQLCSCSNLIPSRDRITSICTVERSHFSLRISHLNQELLFTFSRILGRFKEHFDKTDF